MTKGTYDDIDDIGTRPWSFSSSLGSLWSMGHGQLQPTFDTSFGSVHILECSETPDRQLPLKKVTRLGHDSPGEE